MKAIWSKELKSYFYSPIGYVFIGIFMLVLGILFLTTNISGGTADFASTMHTMSTFFVFLLPLLTMRSFAEERRAKTDQLLLTAPVTITRTVLGKFFACMTVLAAALLVSVIYPIILAILGSPSAGEIFTAYLGFFLMGAAGTALGLLISAATQSQVVAAVATFGVFFMLLMASSAIPLITSSVIRSVLTALSLFDRLADFATGILGLSSVLYYLSFAGVCLFLTIQLIEKRRWSVA